MHKSKPKSPNYGSWENIRPVPPSLHAVGLIDYRWDYVDDAELDSVLPKKLHDPNEEDDHV